MQLLELQNAFWRAVRQRRGQPERVEQWLTASPTQTASQRLAVYHSAYWGRQLTYLLATFARTQAVLGRAPCERLMLAYLEQHPGSDPCIEWLGQGFPAFLVARGDLDSRVCELARLEWASVEALLSPDAAIARGLPRERGAKVTECRFALSPSLRVEEVCRDSWAWFAGAEGCAHDSGLAGAERLTVALCRLRYRVQHLALARDEAEAIAMARRGATLAEICQVFEDLPQSQAAARVSSLLSGWFARGWVAHVA